MSVVKIDELLITIFIFHSASLGHQQLMPVHQHEVGFGVVTSANVDLVIIHPIIMARSMALW